MQNEDMGINLYDYQKEALEKLHTGSILCGSVGSGKSRTAIAYYFSKQGGGIGKNYIPMKEPIDLYIITTARKRDTLEWDGELSPFLLSKDPKLNTYNNKVMIDSWNNISKYVDVKESFFIFDEQRVVGYGQWTKSFLKITKQNDWILLSATPGDTWMDYMPVFIANGFYRNKSDFISQHVLYDWRAKTFPRIDRYFNVARLIRLRNRILVTMDFERKAQAHHEDVYSTYDILKYKSIIKNRWNPWLNKPIDSAGEFCLLLRRVVNSSEERQNDILSIHKKHPKMIVFYNFDYELDILKALPYDEGTIIAEWNGHKHQPVPDSNKWVYLVQYTAGSEGWNCIKTDTIVFYSQNYSYKTMIQASGRIDRLNTPYEHLYYYHLKSKSGIDLAISRALAKKKDFNNGSFYRKYVQQKGDSK